MDKQKQRYDVYRRKVVDSFYEVRVGEWQHMGNTFAVSPKKAIANMKYRLGQVGAGPRDMGSDTSLSYEWKSELAGKKKEEATYA